MGIWVDSQDIHIVWSVQLSMEKYVEWIWAEVILNFSEDPQILSKIDSTLS